MYVCMENFVLYGTRTALTDTNTLCLHAVTGNFYVYVYIQIRVLGRMMMNVTELLFIRTEPDTQIFRVSAVYRTMDLRNDYDKTPVCKNRTGGKELSFNW
jgi:hypothetical protein